MDEAHKKLVKRLRAKLDSLIPRAIAAMFEVRDVASAADALEALVKARDHWADAHLVAHARAEALAGEVERLRQVLTTLATETNISQEERKYHARSALETKP